MKPPANVQGLLKFLREDKHSPNPDAPKGDFEATFENAWRDGEYEKLANIPRFNVAKLLLSKLGNVECANVKPCEAWELAVKAVTKLLDVNAINDFKEPRKRKTYTDERGTGKTSKRKVSTPSKSGPKPPEVEDKGQAAATPADGTGGEKNVSKQSVEEAAGGPAEEPARDPKVLSIETSDVNLASKSARQQHEKALLEEPTEELRGKSRGASMLESGVGISEKADERNPPAAEHAFRAETYENGLDKLNFSFSSEVAREKTFCKGSSTFSLAEQIVRMAGENYAL